MYYIVPSCLRDALCVMLSPSVCLASSVTTTRRQEVDGVRAAARKSRGRRMAALHSPGTEQQDSLAGRAV